MLGFLSDRAVTLLSAGWFGLTIGLIDGEWDNGTTIGVLIYGGLMVVFTWLGRDPPPGDEVAELLEGLSRRDRRAVIRALSSGEDPSDPRLARITHTARRYLRDEPVTPRRRVVGILGTLAVVVIAALSGAPPGWVAAGAVFPLALAALSVAELRRPARRTA
jgi:hypothetical protein